MCYTTPNVGTDVMALDHDDEDEEDQNEAGGKCARLQVRCSLLYVLFEWFVCRCVCKWMVEAGRRCCLSVCVCAVCCTLRHV